MAFLESVLGQSLGNVAIGEFERRLTCLDRETRHGWKSLMATLGMKIEKLKTGAGASPKKGEAVTVHYTGRFADGTKFDSSLDRNEPFTFTLGAGEVIQGWDLGVAKMKIGDKVKLTLAPGLGYGAAGCPGAIPPNSTLVFEVELLAIG